MSKHKEFNDLLKKVGTNRKELAENIDLSYMSVNNQLAPGKELPRWAKSVLFINNKKYENRNQSNQDTDQE